MTGLTAQGVDDVWLWIPDRYDRFGTWDGALPSVPPGVTLRRCGQDHGPATKLLPTLAASGEDDLILICDDDVIYAPGWATEIFDIAKNNPGSAVAVSSFAVRRLGLAAAPSDAVIVQGFAGVCVTRTMLGELAINARDRGVDDIWLSAQLAAKGTPIISANHLRHLLRPIAAPNPLQDEAPGGLTRAQANLRSARALAHELGIWGAKP